MVSPKEQDHLYNERQDQAYNERVAKWEENPKGEIIWHEWDTLSIGEKIKVNAGENSPNYFDGKSWSATTTSEALVVVDYYKVSPIGNGTEYTKELVLASNLSIVYRTRFVKNWFLQGEIVKMTDSPFGDRQVRIVGGYFWKCCAGEPMEGESLADFKARSIEYTVKLEEIGYCSGPDFFHNVAYSV